MTENTSPSSIPYDRKVPTDRPLRIVFMGTPEFAVPALQSLLDGPHEVVAVYTQPDRPQGRGKKITPPPVKVLAQQAGLPVFQPEKMATKESYERFCADAPDLAVVVAYGKILRPKALAVPPLGCINCHASLLPYYRGSAPIQWAIARGETQTGITTMLLDEGMDTGPMLKWNTTPIFPEDTGGSLHDRLSAISAQTLTETLEALVQGTLTITPQDHDRSTHAPMIEKDDLWIDFHKPANEVRNWIRALDPAPGARCLDPNGEAWKFYAPLSVETGISAPAGTLLEVEKDALLIACGQDALRIHSVQKPGKRRMSVQELLAGTPLQTGTLFSKPSTP
ncbi:MAG: methionyl-tRNA formyltransferase [Myxococcales bacterium]|nr:methionyl-tRNA formyltransferase [Myxococcales bacterium]MCB9644900.1 methionyl-tRNA formyltransferase [Myxococcales bacterium]